MSSTIENLIVQKYGGATLADPKKIQDVARRVFEMVRSGKHVVMVVSAMGKSTNSLIELAHQVSPHPLRRELDMLLSTGERVSMALVSMALNDLGATAISFTGSQAGILTDDNHQNAFIKNVTPQRITEALSQNKVVVLAGFQGVSPKSKEITTLGRGGSDTTAVAITAALNASHCEILKDVSSIYSADPNYVTSAQPLHRLNYKHLLDMTFWGAKVLHYRSVELAQTRKVKLYIGPAHNATDGLSKGTWVLDEGDFMFETNQILSLNSHESVLELQTQCKSLSEGLELIEKAFSKGEIAFPQILHMEQSVLNQSFYVTGPAENIASITDEVANINDINIYSDKFSTVTATCTGATTPELTIQMLSALNKIAVSPKKTFHSALSTTFLVSQNQRKATIECLHKLISQDSKR